MDNILERRKELGITQVNLAKMVGVSLTTIRQWEAGIMRPNEENMVRLIEALGGKKGR